MNALARSCAGIALGWIAVAMAAGPAPAQQAPAAPARFERVLWCSDAAGAALAARSGYTAVQLGRGADPAPLQALGLGTQPRTAADCWRRLADAVLPDADLDPVVEQPLRTILRRGPLARRLLTAVGLTPDRAELDRMCLQLADCLHAGVSFGE